jgi:hypothetical protein
MFEALAVERIGNIGLDCSARVGVGVCVGCGWIVGEGMKICVTMEIGVTLVSPN